jgi:hypothetical protein
MRTTGKRIGSLVVSVGLATGVGTIVVTPVGAAEFTVTNNNDSGPGSLRQALIDAGSNPGDDRIVVTPGLGTIVASSPLVHDGPSGAGGVEIVGNGVTIDANGATTGIIDAVGAKPFVLSGIAVTGVGPGATTHAGAVVSDGGGVTISDCTITDNVISTDGTGHWNAFAAAVLSVGNPISITSCTISDNQVSTTNESGDAAGGVLSQGDPVAIVSSTISGNRVETADGGAGGGVFSNGGSVTFRDVAVNCNNAVAGTLDPQQPYAPDAAGGLLSEGGPITISGSSIQGNGAASVAGNAANQILNDGGAENISSSVISDSQDVCQTPSTSTTPPPTTAPPTTLGSTPPPPLRPAFTG